MAVPTDPNRDPGSAPGETPDQSPADVLTLTLEVDPSVTPIRGRLIDAPHEVAFSGWLGLADALRRFFPAAGTGAGKEKR